ncbi:hypothetical protein GGS24DRAFT_206354 [Hypoxylon argillaceum]|nr:hypothetical protein GGS24DRAFT_206354 [Hypoxylon argillaceum]
MFSFPEPKGLIRRMGAGKSTIGVELEFLVAVAQPNQKPLNVPRMFQKSNGAPIVLPRDGSQETVGPTLLRIENTIKTAAAKHRGARVFGPKDEEALDKATGVNGVDTDLIHLRRYQDWSVGRDLSVYLDYEEIEDQEHISDYLWQNIEIASPALWATDESWDEIRAVVQALSEEYWIITPRSAGMHYHYGNGKNYIPFGKLRRMAALLVAVDPIIVQLHPEHRRDYDLAVSNRLYSRIAHGLPAEVTSRELRVEYVEEEPEFPRVRASPAPAARPSLQRTPDLVVPFRRGQLKGYKFNPVTFFETGYPEDAEAFANILVSKPRPLEIPYAVREILRCLNAPTVAELMRYSPILEDRPAYSFQNYTLDLYKRLSKSFGELDLQRQNKRTIEFRQMASTMEPDEVVAHGKIIVRLCEFATEADLEALWKVVLDCTVAEVNGAWFDVFDLLVELGLAAEAKVLQHSVARFRGETIPDEITLKEMSKEKSEETQAAEERVVQRAWWRKWLGWRSG